MKRTTIGLAMAAALAALMSAGVSSATGATTSVQKGSCTAPLPEGSEVVTLDPADFVERIDHPYWPMASGDKWVYREADTHGNAQRVRVNILHRTKEVAGITASVAHDRVTLHGELVENTFDWYAQDTCGNMWYLGENTREYENGEVVSRAGSWETGVDGAQAGIALPADTTVGLGYRQEYYAGEAEDVATVVGVDEQVQVPAGHWRSVVMTRDETNLHPRVAEHKFYAKGIGPVLTLGISGGGDREELLSHSEGDGS